jgi:hypothetical protein
MRPLLPLVVAAGPCVLLVLVLLPLLSMPPTVTAFLRATTIAGAGAFGVGRRHLLAPSSAAATRVGARRGAAAQTQMAAADGGSGSGAGKIGVRIS